MKKPLKVGVVGCGDIATLRYLCSINQIEGMQLEATCDIIESKARKACETFGAKKYYLDYQTMLAKVDIDVVIVTVPHVLHAPVTIDCLKAGKHVLVEKPMATTYEDTLAMAAAAKKAGRLLFPMPYNYTPEYMAVKKAITDGMLGEVSQIWMNLSHSGPTHASWFYKKELAKHGVLIDLGVYPITMALGLLGPVKSVNGITNQLNLNRSCEDSGDFLEEVEDNVAIQLRYNDAKITSVQVNWCTGVSKDMDSCLYEIKVYGTKGYIYADVLKKKAFLYSQLNTDAAGNNPGLVKLAIEAIPEEISKRWDGPIILKEFFNTLNSGALNVSWLNMEHQVIEIITKSYTASETGQAQEIKSRF
jgi:predicted dehydrogenase